MRTQWRFTPFIIVGAQIGASFFCALLFALWTSSWMQGGSAVIGGVLGWLPNVFFICIIKVFSSQKPVKTVWILAEAVKIILTVLMFMLVLRFFPQVVWIPLGVTYCVTLKLVWMLGLSWR
jgi:ATP synthase protein I